MCSLAASLLHPRWMMAAASIPPRSFSGEAMLSNTVIDG
jgi:hypothetical protein